MSTATLGATPAAASSEPLVRELDERRGSFGMALFMLGEAMLFAVLFAAYYYLGPQTSRWEIHEPPKLHYALPMLAILLVSSGVLYWGEEKVKQEIFRPGKLALVITSSSGASFSASAISISPSTSGRCSRRRTRMIHLLHDHRSARRPPDSRAAHARLGARPAALGPGGATPHKPYHNGAMYWHFVDTVWVFIVAILYVYPNLVH